MSFIENNAPSASPVAADATGAPALHSVKELKSLLFESLPQARALVAAVLRHWPGVTPCDAPWLLLVNARWESIRQRTVRGIQTANLHQARHHAITEAIGPLLGPVAALDLAPRQWEARLPRLRALLNFALRPTERVLLDFLERGPPEQAGERLQARAQAVREMETRLNLAGILATGLPAQGEFDFALELQEEDPPLAFGRALVRLRRAQGLSLAKFARRVGIGPSNLLHYEKGRLLPGHAATALLARLVAVGGGTELMAAYRISRNFRDRQKPRCLRNDVDLWAYVTPEHKDQFEAFMDHENSRQHVPRRGRLNSGGKLAPNSRKTYYLFFRQMLATLQLPRDESNPRRSGLGLPATAVSFLDLTHLPFLKAHFERQNRRRGRDTFARGDQGMLGKVIDLCSEEGYIYRHAERLAECLPAASLERCPTRWPEGSDRPGAACLTGAERIRARCRETRRDLAGWRRTAATAAPSTQHLRRLAPLLARSGYPLDAVMEIFHRHHRRIPRNPQEAQRLLALALLAMQCWRPRRPEEFGLLRIEDLVLGEDGQTSALSHPKKNSGSLRARQQIFQALPPELAQPVRDYLEYARPLLKPGPVAGRDRVFCNRQGGVLSPQTVGDLLRTLVEQLAPDLFPMGLNPHALRTIVATDLYIRFGPNVGLHLAAEALIDHKSTTLNNYIVHASDPARLQRGDRTQEAAIAAAWRAATGRPFRRQPLR